MGFIVSRFSVDAFNLFNEMSDSTTHIVYRFGPNVHQLILIAYPVKSRTGYRMSICRVQDRTTFPPFEHMIPLNGRARNQLKRIR